MKEGNWYGDNAVVLDEDDESLVIIIGTYGPTEIDKIKQGLAREDPETDLEYGDYILSVTQEEWEEQQTEY